MFPPQDISHIGFTLETPKAMFNLAGLYEMHGLSQDDVMEALIEGRTHQYHAVVHHFVPVRSDDRAPFMAELRNTFCDNFSDIYEQFGSTYPDRVHLDGDLLSLPTSVIYELIRLN